MIGACDLHLKKKNPVIAQMAFVDAEAKKAFETILIDRLKQWLPYDVVRA